MRRLISPTALLTAILLAVFLLTPAAADADEPDLLNHPAFREATKDLTAAQQFDIAARLYMRVGRFDRAIPLLEVLVRREDYKNQVDLWHLLAESYNGVDEPVEALKAARIAQALAPDLTALRLESGIAAVRLNRPDAALRDLVPYVRKWGTDAVARYYLGLAYAQAEQHEKSRRHLERAAQLNPLLEAQVEYQRALLDVHEGRLHAAFVRLAPLHAAMRRHGLPAHASTGRQLGRVGLAREVQRTIHAADVAAAARHLPTLQPRETATGPDEGERETTIAGVN